MGKTKNLIFYSLSDCHLNKDKNFVGKLDQITPLIVWSNTRIFSHFLKSPNIYFQHATSGVLF